MTEVEALHQENESLKTLLGQLDAQKIALSSTVNDVLQANVNLKAGGILLEKQIATLNQTITTQDARIKELESKVA